ncbi:MAG: non-canonical purine NTP pyrophosphatase [Candidatus Ornithospirochaeta sp.]
MKVLLGTTNPSKVDRFSHLLAGYDIEFLTLNDIGNPKEPEEKGETPEENARIKALFYGSFAESVICSDSGLYFKELDMADPQQPGLKIRTPMGRKRLKDEEMIEYYSSLINSLGGKVTAYYVDGIAVCHKGKVTSFMNIDSAQETGSFFMIDNPSSKRFPGWPLDSLSINIETGKYFVDVKRNDSKENIIKDKYKVYMLEYLKEALEL